MKDDLSYLPQNKHFWSVIFNSIAVWNELEKENKEFFEAYSQSQNKEDQMSETKSSAMVQKTISDPDHNPGPDPDHDHDQENPKDSK